MNTNFKIQLKTPSLLLLCLIILAACDNHKRLISEEVILKNNNSVTGTLLLVDSTNVTIMKSDESKVNISWSEIDTIIGKRFKSFFVGANTGYYNIPYFSVFRNEAINSKALGIQFKAGKAIRGRSMNYFTYTYSPGKPYHINKFGIGTMRYIKKARYTNEKGFFWGLEYNLLNAKHNNGVQMCLDPYWGFDYKLGDQLRLHGKMGFQFNVANKNNNLGINLTVGIHYFKRNFNKYYTTLNKEHRLPKQ